MLDNQEICPSEQFVGGRVRDDGRGGAASSMTLLALAPCSLVSAWAAHVHSPTFQSF
jgi:hypothetical protein